MTTRILLLSFYYPPDLSAGSFRAEALVNALCAELGDQVEIELVTTQPNRYHSFTANAVSIERLPLLTIRRIDVPAHRSGIRDQAQAFASFALNALKITRKKKYDLVFATSSRLMTASLGALIAKRNGCGLYLDIRDILVDTLRELLPSRWGLLAASIFSPIERWTVNQATKVNLISPGFLPYFTTRYPGREFTLYTNGVDDLFIEHSEVPQLSVPQRRTQRLQVVYAGNIGTGQGLHQILPELAKRLADKVEFHLIGAGSALEALNESLEHAEVDNVRISPPMRRDQLLRIYCQADVLFLHLNNLKAFRRVLPSKLFEYAATDKPIWGGLSGYAGRFAQKRIKNVALFPPCDIESAIQAFQRLEIQKTSRLEFVQQFSRRSIKKKMAQDILQISPKYLARSSRRSLSTLPESH
ncbi:glycosyltransferase family 4 protein [Pseudomonas monteilii]|uniref:glycosyltransferase family 4 protein n=1 Tax=Pseudomonas TaxID=286 RepID=UPI00049089AD|nr:MULTISPECIES: glycosyltransferase family 4 protein [Pseudomonas]MBA1316011.1 glycosyltransferase family 4 protein [Pseudomonas monteilii]MBA6092037.1 glycosyltransferase family 4 protein [Pseudomonas monteilii]MCE1020325.1 glycosyltransferase family 4 protein [Pseudomonas monteilii]MCE1037804.1 glycosyltransferase family 4 protein [Pseudomonas monteilii]MCE1090779.1 glycosyltransferase family 4 protein [Pseudomonas monteilii]